MIAASVSGRSRDRLHAELYGETPTSSAAAREVRARLLTRPELPHGRGTRTTGELPDRLGHELCRALRELLDTIASSPRAADESQSERDYTLKALRADIARLDSQLNRRTQRADDTTDSTTN